MMMGALFSLSISIQQLGPPTPSPRYSHCVEQTLHSFAQALFRYLQKGDEKPTDSLIQDVWDVAFIRQIIRLWFTEKNSDKDTIEIYISGMREKVMYDHPGSESILMFLHTYR